MVNIVTLSISSMGELPMPTKILNNNNYAIDIIRLQGVDGREDSNSRKRVCEAKVFLRTQLSI